MWIFITCALTTTPQMLPLGYMCAWCVLVCVCVSVCVRVCVCVWEREREWERKEKNVDVCVCTRTRVFVLTGFKCSFLSGIWLGETLEKAEKSRTRTYGPPSAFQLAAEGEIQDALKNGSKREKQESLNNVTEPSNGFKPVYKMWKKVITVLFVFLEKKSIKNQIGKSCVDRKDCSKPSHWRTLPDNSQSF